MVLAKLSCSPIFFGAAIAVLVVTFQVVFKDVVPLAYGICTVCHARDLLSWIVNHVVRFSMDTPVFASRALVLTPLGLVTGSFLASKRAGEFSWVRASSPVLMLIGGVLVSISGLLIMSCPTRLILRLAFGDTLALFAVIGLFAGIAVSTVIMRKVR